MLDNNIFISAALFSKGKESQAFIKAIQEPFPTYVCDYIEFNKRTAASQYLLLFKTKFQLVLEGKQKAIEITITPVGYIQIQFSQIFSQYFYELNNLETL